MKHLNKLKQAEIDKVSPYETIGRVIKCNDTLIKASLPGCFLGEAVEIEAENKRISKAVVKSFVKNTVILQPVSTEYKILPFAKVRGLRKKLAFNLRKNPLGKIYDAEGKPLSGEPEEVEAELEIESETISPLDRTKINTQLISGVKAIDRFSPIGLGQRMVILSPPGCGKSSLVSALSMASNVDIVITALVGERGREVASYYENSKSRFENHIIISSTADESPIRKIVAGKSAFAVAEHYRKHGKRVLLLFDSLTRYLRALRDLGLSSGELPIRQGYPASVFKDLPMLLERAGNHRGGSITAIFTMLSNNSIDEDPMINEVMGIVDGHIRLRRGLAEELHFPAIDISESMSRLGNQFLDKADLNINSELKRIFHKCTNELFETDRGSDSSSKLKAALCQEQESRFSLQETKQVFNDVFEAIVN